jgi:hypothetical protein
MVTYFAWMDDRIVQEMEEAFEARMTVEEWVDAMARAMQIPAEYLIPQRGSSADVLRMVGGESRCGRDGEGP